MQADQINCLKLSSNIVCNNMHKNQPSYSQQNHPEDTVLFTYHLFLALFYDIIIADTGDCAGRYSPFVFGVRGDSKHL